LELIDVVCTALYTISHYGIGIYCTSDVHFTANTYARHVRTIKTARYYTNTTADTTFPIIVRRIIFQYNIYYIMMKLKLEYYGLMEIET